MFCRQRQDVIFVADVDIFFSDPRQIRRQDISLVRIFDIYLRNAVVRFCRIFKTIEEVVKNRIREYKITVRYNWK